MNTEKSYAFWPYDTFPYVLGSVIDNDISVTNGKAYARSHSYQGLVYVAHQESVEEGAALSQMLTALDEAYKQEQKLLHEKYKKMALAFAPFLNTFPAYKK